MPLECPQPDFISHFFLHSFSHPQSCILSLSLSQSSTLFARTAKIENDPEKLQGLKMIQIFRIHPHLDNAKITSSSQLLQDTLIVKHL